MRSNDCGDRSTRISKSPPVDELESVNSLRWSTFEADCCSHECPDRYANHNVLAPAPHKTWPGVDREIHRTRSRINIVAWGFFTLYLRHSDRLRPGVVSCLLGAVILWGMFSAFQRDMAVGFLEELWSRNLVSLFASPLSVPEYVTGLTIVTLGKAMIGLIVESLIAWLFYHYNIFPMLPTLIPFILNLALFALTIGVVVAGLIFRYTTKFQAMTWSFASLLMPLSCVFLSLELVAGLSATDGVGAAHHPLIRRYAPGYRKRRVLELAFHLGVSR